MSLDLWLDDGRKRHQVHELTDQSARCDGRTASRIRAPLGRELE